MPPEPSDDLLLRYLGGQLTADEVVQVRRFIDANAQRRGVVHGLQAAIRAEDIDGSPPDPDAALAVFLRRLHQEYPQEHLRPSLETPRRIVCQKEGVFSGWTLRGMPSLETRIFRGWKWPAGIVALCALLTVLFSHHSTPSFGATRTYATAVGQRATLLLDDGTHVMLAPQTTLTLVRSRTLVLDGDAYFEVAPSAHAPFVVQAGTTTTRVLGTAFAVRHYHGDAEVRVAVATGKVLVSNGLQHPAMSVTAGHVASVTDSTQMVKAVDNIDTEIGWLGDRLVFQDAPMPKVLATLTRWYGYQFRVTDSTLVQHNITIGLSMHSSTEALASLEQILNVSLTVVGDTVTLTPVVGGTAPHQRSKHYDMWVPTREVGR